MATKYCDLDATGGADNGSSTDPWETVSSMTSGVSAGDVVYIKGSETNAATGTWFIDFPNSYNNPVFLVGLKTTATFGSETESDVASAKAGDTLPQLSANTTAEYDMYFTGDVVIVGLNLESARYIGADDGTNARANVVLFDCYRYGTFLRAVANDSAVTSISGKVERHPNNTGEDFLTFCYANEMSYGIEEVIDSAADPYQFIIDGKERLSWSQNSIYDQTLFSGNALAGADDSLTRIFDSAVRTAHGYLDGCALSDDTVDLALTQSTNWVWPWSLVGYTDTSSDTSMGSGDTSTINMEFLGQFGRGGTNETTYRDDGATAGLVTTNNFSIELEANAGIPGPRSQGGGWHGMRSPWFQTWADGGGTELTVTVHFCNDSGADLDENEVFLEVFAPPGDGTAGYRYYTNWRRAPEIDTPATHTDGTDGDWTFGTGFGNAQEISITIPAADAPDAAGWVKARLWNTAYAATTPVVVCVCPQIELS